MILCTVLLLHDKLIGQVHGICMCYSVPIKVDSVCSKVKSGKEKQCIPVVLGNMPSSGPQKSAWHLLALVLAPGFDQ